MTRLLGIIEAFKTGRKSNPDTSSFDQIDSKTRAALLERVMHCNLKKAVKTSFTTMTIDAVAIDAMKQAARLVMDDEQRMEDERKKNPNKPVHPTQPVARSLHALLKNYSSPSVGLNEPNPDGLRKKHPSYQMAVFDLAQLFANDICERKFEYGSNVVSVGVWGMPYTQEELAEKFRRRRKKSKSSSSSSSKSSSPSKSPVKKKKSPSKKKIESKKAKEKEEEEEEDEEEPSK